MYHPWEKTVTLFFFFLLLHSVVQLNYNLVGPISPRKNSLVPPGMQGQEMGESPDAQVLRVPPGTFGNGFLVGDVFWLSQLRGATGVQRVEARNATEHPTTHRTSPQNKIIQLKISNVMAERPLTRLIFHFQPHDSTLPSMVPGASKCLACPGLCYQTLLLISPSAGFQGTGFSALLSLLLLFHPLVIFQKFVDISNCYISSSVYIFFVFKFSFNGGFWEGVETDMYVHLSHHV